MKNFIWNYKEKCIRGWIINVLITLVILMLIIFGAFNDQVAVRLEKLTLLITGFYTTSFAVWRLSKSFGNKNHADPGPIDRMHSED